MKSIPSALQAHYNTGATSMANAIVIQRTDGTRYAFTSADVPVTMDVSAWYTGATAQVFNCTQGFNASSIITSSAFDVGNLELTTLDDGTLFNHDDVLGGRWRNASFYIFRYRLDIATPTLANDVELLVRGTFGNVTLQLNTVVVELRDLSQKLQQDVGIVSSPTCRARLGDSACTVNLAPYTFSLTVTGVTDRKTFTCSGATQGADYFGNGTVTFNTGNNAGISQKVNSFSGGVFTLSLGMTLDIQVGDTLTAIAGCRKRHQSTYDGTNWTVVISDCRDKFNNLVNFQGEPHRPTVDVLTSAI